ncbi:MAG: nucleoside deaminase [Prochlorotrichaceae cyanobacterium]|jgi:guanine deaminase
MTVILTPTQRHWMQLAIEAAQQGLRDRHGGPFGAIVVKDDVVLGRGHNQVTSLKDPTAHAEMVAIRQACQVLEHFQLTGCELYTTCEPCPMCLGAIYWARPDRVYYANTRFDAAAIDFDDQMIYVELAKAEADRSIPFIHAPDPQALELFEQWRSLSDRILY